MYILSRQENGRREDEGKSRGESPGQGFLMDKILRHPCFSSISLKGDLLGACRLPHFIFLARYTVLALKHISCYIWTTGRLKCLACDIHLDKWVYHPHKEGSCFFPTNIITFPRPYILIFTPQIWCKTDHLSAFSDDLRLWKKSGPSVGKRHKACHWEAWQSPENTERGKNGLKPGFNGELLGDFHLCLFGLTCSLWSLVGESAMRDELNIHHCCFSIFVRLPVRHDIPIFS